MGKQSLTGPDIWRCFPEKLKPGSNLTSRDAVVESCELFREAPPPPPANPSSCNFNTDYTQTSSDCGALQYPVVRLLMEMHEQNIVWPGPGPVSKTGGKWENGDLRKRLSVYLLPARLDSSSKCVRIATCTCTSRSISRNPSHFPPGWRLENANMRLRLIHVDAEAERKKWRQARVPRGGMCSVCTTCLKLMKHCQGTSATVMKLFARAWHDKTVASCC